jgi:hydrogenase maturation protease
MVIGIGNPLRGDDAIGAEAAALLRARPNEVAEVVTHDGEPSGLMDLWEGRGLVVVIDAVASGNPPGTVLRMDAGVRKLPADYFAASTHLMGLPEAVELARSLGRLPEDLIVFGIEATAFEPGAELSDAARKGIDEALRRIEDELYA